MAYADGMLEAEQRAAVEEYLASDAEAGRQVEAFRRSRTQAAAAFGKPMREPPPDRLIAAIMGAAPPQGQPASARVVELRPGRSTSDRTRRLVGLSAMAASLALVAGLAGFLAGRASAPSSASSLLALGRVPADNALARLLETRPSGSSIAFGESPGSRAAALSAQVVATFRDRSGRVCREIEVGAVGSADTPQMVGIACRGTAGEWLVEGAVRVISAGTAPASSYKPSGASGSDALEGVLQGLGAGTALTTVDEQQLLSRGWR